MTTKATLDDRERLCVTCGRVLDPTLALWPDSPPDRLTCGICERLDVMLRHLRDPPGRGPGPGEGWRS